MSTTHHQPDLAKLSTIKDMTIAVYATHEEAEDTVRSLQKSGFDMTMLSIVGSDYHTEEHVVGYYTTGNRMLAWGKFGAFWGGMWGLLFGAAFFVIPGIGPVLLAGPFAGWLVGALEGAVVGGGLSALGGALVGMGVPASTALEYETEIKAGRFLLVVHGTPAETEGARALLTLTHHEGIAEYGDLGKNNE